MAEPRVSPGLARAVADALQLFVNQWPKADSLAVWHRSPEQRQAMINHWGRNLIGITYDAITDAASRWLGDPNHIVSNTRLLIPTPATFAKYARQVDRTHFRAHVPTGPTPDILPGRAHDLGVRAYRILGSWPAVSLVSEELLKLAPDREAEQRIRQHRIGTKPSDPWPRVEHFDEAIEIVRARLERMEAERAIAQRVPA